MNPEVWQICTSLPPVSPVLVPDILDKAPVGTPEGREVRREVWEFNILQMLIIIVRQDFSILPGEWRTAAKLAMLIR